MTRQGRGVTIEQLAKRSNCIKFHSSNFRNDFKNAKNVKIKCGSIMRLYTQGAAILREVVGIYFLKYSSKISKIFEKSSSTGRTDRWIDRHMDVGNNNTVNAVSGGPRTENLKNVFRTSWWTLVTGPNIQYRIREIVVILARHNSQVQCLVHEDQLFPNYHWTKGPPSSNP